MAYQPLWVIHYIMKSTKTICCTKSESVVDHNNQMIEEIFHMLQESRCSSKPKTMDSLVVLKVIETNPVSSTWRVSGELGILQFSVVGTISIHNLLRLCTMNINSVKKNGFTLKTKAKSP